MTVIVWIKWSKKWHCHSDTNRNFAEEKLFFLLQVVVDFVYTGMLALTVENVEEVLSAATHLQVSIAVELCSKYLEMAITVDNCVDILNLSELYSLGSMSSRARQFILENFEVWCHYSGFDSLHLPVFCSYHYFLLTSGCSKIWSFSRLIIMNKHA